MGCNKSSCGGCSCGEKPSNNISGPVEKHSPTGSGLSTKRSISMFPKHNKEIKLEYPIKQVFILRSLPGTDINPFLKQFKNAAVVSNDDHFRKWDGVKFIKEKINDARQKCMKNFLRAIETERQIIVVNNPNIYAYDIAPYVLLGESKDYKVTIININSNPEEAFKKQIYGYSKEEFFNMVADASEEKFPDYWAIETVEA